MTEFTYFNDYKLLDANWQTLFFHAESALANAYAPYSNFRVSASILTSGNKIVTGTNQENAAYPSGMCAERVALHTLSSIASGEHIIRMLLLARKGTQTGLSPASPCGACRQVMLEFENRQTEPFQVLMMIDQHRWVLSNSASALLPFTFSSKNLKDS